MHIAISHRIFEYLDIVVIFHLLKIYTSVMQVFLEFYAFSIDKNVDDDIVITQNKNEISASRQELLSAKCTIYFFRY